MNMTVNEAACLLGGSEQWVRSLCKRNKIGDAWSCKRYPQRMAYVIVPGKLAEYMRISEDELNRRLKAIRKKESDRYIDGLLRANL